MKIPINLASQPFRRDRAMLVASAAVAVLLVASLAVLITLANADNAQLADVRKEVAQLRTQIAAATKQQAEFEAVIRKPENAQVLELSVFLNTLLSRKGISWTRILADLEKTMPPNVKVLNIQPYVTGRNQVVLEPAGGLGEARAGDPVLQSAGEFRPVRRRHAEYLSAAFAGGAVVPLSLHGELCPETLTSPDSSGRIRASPCARFWAFSCWPTWWPP